MNKNCKKYCATISRLSSPFYKAECAKCNAAVTKLTTAVPVAGANISLIYEISCGGYGATGTRHGSYCGGYKISCGGYGAAGASYCRHAADEGN